VKYKPGDIVAWTDESCILRKGRFYIVDDVRDSEEREGLQEFTLKQGNGHKVGNPPIWWLGGEPFVHRRRKK
jgi:hypothetical protein